MYVQFQPFIQNQPPNGWVAIRSQMHGKVLDVDEGRNEAGTKVIVWPHKSPPENNQKWRFEACAPGWYHIVSALRPNLVLDVEGGEARDCAPLVLWNRKTPPEPNQMFRLNGNHLESALGMVLDIEGASRADGANVILFSQKHASDAVNQAFDFLLVDGAMAQPSWTAPQASPYSQPAFNPYGMPTASVQPFNLTPVPQPAAAVGSWVVIRSRMHGKVLDVEGGRAKAGTRILVWDQNYTAHQKWRFEPCGNGWCHVVSALNSNLVMDVKDGQARQGAPIILWDRKYPAEGNQMFRMKGQCIESALGGGLVLDIEGGSRGDGARLIVFPEKCAGDRTNQSFVLQSI